MNELIIGKMTSQQLAKWFNISYSTYSHNIDKYLIQLKEFCIYDKVYGGVIVREIFYSVYDKKL